MSTAVLWMLTAWAAPPSTEAPACSGADARRELVRHAKADQRDRNQWVDDMASRDAVRLAAVHRIVSEGRVCSGKSAFAAGVVLQHSAKRADFALAHRMFRFAADEGVKGAERWAALAWDRYLVSGGEPQWFGTQFQGQHADDGAFLFQCLVAVDPESTDADRIAIGALPLSERIAGVYRTNGKEIPSELTMDALEADGFVCEPVVWGE